MSRLFFLGYFNDILAGAIILSSTNLLLSATGLQPLHWPGATLLVLLCGLFWELVPPLYKPGAVCDPLDLVAYLLGGWIYFLSACKYHKKDAVS